MYKFVRTHEDKRGKAITVVNDVPEVDVMTRTAEELIHSSTSACHVSQTTVDGKVKRFVEGEVDYVVEG